MAVVVHTPGHYPLARSPICKRQMTITPLFSFPLYQTLFVIKTQDMANRDLKKSDKSAKANQKTLDLQPKLLADISSKSQSYIPNAAAAGKLHLKQQS